MKKLSLMAILSPILILSVHAMNKVDKPGEKNEYKPKEQSYNTVPRTCKFCKVINYVSYYPGREWYNCKNCKKPTLFVDKQNKYPNHNKIKD